MNVGANIFLVTHHWEIGTIRCIIRRWLALWTMCMMKGTSLALCAKNRNTFMPPCHFAKLSNHSIRNNFKDEKVMQHFYILFNNSVTINWKTGKLYIFGILVTRWYIGLHNWRDFDLLSHFNGFSTKCSRFTSSGSHRIFNQQVKNWSSLDQYWTENKLVLDWMEKSLKNDGKYFVKLSQHRVKTLQME